MPLLNGIIKNGRKNIGTQIDWKEQDAYWEQQFAEDYAEFIQQNGTAAL